MMGGVDDPYLLPPVVRQKAESLGDEGRAWLSALPDLVAELESRWSVRVHRSLGGGTSAFVGAARTADGRPVVLKLAVPEVHTGDEIATLARAAGRGYVQLLAHDRGRRAMLLEALGPALVRSDLVPERQLETLCRLLRTAWTVPPPESGEPHDRAPGLEELVGRLWEQLGGPVDVRVRDQAVRCARRRSAAFDPAWCVLVHGDAAAANALQVRTARPGAETGYVFVDPDGYLGDPAYDLGVALRDWCPELLAASDPSGLARRYCRTLAAHSGHDEDAIWEWGYLERVSTGLYCLAMGADELGRPFLQTAAALL